MQALIKLAGIALGIVLCYGISCTTSNLSINIVVQDIKIGTFINCDK